LIAQKVEEKITLPNLDWDFHRQQLIDLEAEHRDEQAVNDLLLQLRLASK